MDAIWGLDGISLYQYSCCPLSRHHDSCPSPLAFQVLDSACEMLRADGVSAIGLQGDVRELASCER